MLDEKKYLLEKINNLIEVNTTKLLRRMPHVHDIDDGIIIRFFDDWGECESHEGLKFKKIINDNDPNDITVFYFIPKKTILDDVDAENISTLICMSGKINVLIEKKSLMLAGSNKMVINNQTFTATAIEDTYVITLSK